MSDAKQKMNLFKNGSSWVRADFHLHTLQDQEFTYMGEDNEFVASYIKGLKDANIRIGVITNHNKFDLDEFKALQKKANKEEIFLLPGVELSVNDGANGIHTLIVFSASWIESDSDYINQFLNVTFAGKQRDQYEQENGRSNDSLIETIKKLESYHRDFIIIFGHVEQKGGIWNELDGGRLIEMGKNDFFRRRTLGFQKVRTHDIADRVCRLKVQSWMKDCYPAEVEGSDNKSIEQIGKGKITYLKIGNFNFEALKYALLDHKNRLSDTAQQYKHSHIQSISFEGGVLNGHTVNFSPELNGLIGIRGSGKSSILETLRYVIDMPFGEKALDVEYKNALVSYTLGSGGKAVIKAVDQHGQLFEIRRILNETSDVYVEGLLQPGVSIRETILRKPIYFGQKDLSSTGEGFEKDLVEKIVGERLYDVRRRIEEQKQRVNEAVEHLQSLKNVDEQKKEYEIKTQDAEFRLKIFKEHGVEERLKKQVEFETDSRKIKQILEFIQGYISSLIDFIAQFEDDFNNLTMYKSKQNESFFRDFFNTYSKLLTAFQNNARVLSESQAGLDDLKTKANQFDELKKGLKEEFAVIERKLAEELKDSGVKSIRPDEFLTLRRNLEKAKQMLTALKKQQLQKNSRKKELLEELGKLNELWHEEFKAIKGELEKVNKNHTALTISAEYKEDKKAFLSFMKDMFRGSRIRETTFQTLVDTYADFGGMYKEPSNVMSVAGSSSEILKEYFLRNLKIFLTWQVPHRFIIKYRDKELKHHSLGQRASALILFVLSQRENDVIIIDQPEDDLDNQTIYEDVIKLVKELKCKTQFIFATHNANIPVLGDAEQIHACKYSDENIELESGSVDSPVLQKEIVDIMEGGEEAFNRRKEIYRIWKPQTY